MKFNLKLVVSLFQISIYIRLHGTSELFYSNYSPEAFNQFHRNIMEYKIREA